MLRKCFNKAFPKGYGGLIETDGCVISIRNVREAGKPASY
jgi:hypothetical protein